MKKGEKQRTQEVVLYQRRTIAKNYLKGKSQAEISRIVNLSQPAVANELEILRRQWVQAANVDFAEAQGAALQKIDDMEQEALDQYEKSKQSKKIMTRKRVPKTTIPNGQSEVDEVDNIIEPQSITRYVVVEESIRVEEGTGDVRWHDQVMKCIDMRLKVLGLYRQTTKEGADGRLIPVSLTKETVRGKAALFLAIFEEWDDTHKGN
jgi:hypothetical protein